ncbi:MAG: EcsC family protein [Cyanobacteria bacterium J06638_28]
MSAPTPQSSSHKTSFDEATRMMQAFFEMLQARMDTTADSLVNLAYPAITQGTEILGQTVAPVADIPFIKYATGLPGLSWLLAALGQVNADEISRSVANLRREHPLENEEQLVQRVIAKSTWQAAQVGLLTNLLPPLAIFLFAVDIGAIAALQAEMIYRIAAIYGFPPDDSVRRGEVLAIWGFSTSSSSFLKSGLSLIEILPGIGTALGITSDATIVYGVGFLACRYYEVKRTRQP